MDRRRERILAWSFVGSGGMLAAADLVLVVLTWGSPTPTGSFGVLGFGAVIGLMAAVVGTLVASRVEVTLAHSDGELRFEVADDGRGFDPESTPPGMGLQNMTDRLEALGGSLRVASSPGAGTRLTGRIPIAQGPKA